MSNLRLVRQAYKAFKHGDITAIIEFIDPEIEVHDPGGGVEPQERHGQTGLIDSVRNMRTVWEDFRLELDEAIDLGDRVLALVRMSGRGRHGGVPVQAKVAHLWAIRGERAVRLEIFTDWDAARAAVDRVGAAAR